jgi:histidine triad (HIT) family protein
MNDCLFCTIAAGKQGELIWENEVAVAFRDIHPKAPIHLLVVPKQHFANLDDLDDRELGGRLLEAVKLVAAQEGISGAYRVQVNNGRSAGQIIDHLHFHLLNG